MTASRDVRLRHFIAAVQDAGFEDLMHLQRELRRRAQDGNQLQFLSLLAAAMIIGDGIGEEDLGVVACREKAQNELRSLYRNDLYLDAMVLAAMARVVFEDFAAIGWEENRETLHRARLGIIYYVFDRMQHLTPEKISEFYFGVLLFASAAILNVEIDMRLQSRAVEEILAELKRQGRAAEAFIARACWLQLKYRGLLP